MEKIDKFLSEINENDFKYIFSSPLKSDVKKIIIREVYDKQHYWLKEEYRGNQVFHSNIDLNSLKNVLIDTFNNYNQCCIHNKNYTSNIFNYTDKVVVKKSNIINNQNLTHNKIKKYIINEGDKIDALVDLNVFTKDYKIISSKYDKFKQINKFVEIIDEKIGKINKKSLNIIDFGCGKSYLTFILYYYLTAIKNIDVTITGYDLKKDVVEKCNELAIKYNYKNLKFYNDDIANVEVKDNVDMLVTLHACDTATDYALNFAINKNIKYIFSVPCCQHEINSNIKTGGDFDILLEYGVVKDRFCALLTDSIRAQILKHKGYKVDLLEFVDFEHTPKNIMIRAEKTSFKEQNLSDITEFASKYKFKQTLLELQV